MIPGHNGEYYICPSCQIASTDHQFNKDMYEHGYSDTFERYADNKKGIQLNNLRKNWIKKYFSAGTMLDFGCSIGTFCGSIKSEIIEPIGYDVSEEAIEKANHRYPDIDFTSSPDIFFTNQKYGCITAFDVVEHLPDPLALIKQFHRMLCSYGYLFISTPNLGILKDSIIPKSWRHYKPLEHLHYFKSHNLISMVDKAGFKIIDLDFKESEVRDTYENNILCLTAQKK